MVYPCIILLTSCVLTPITKLLTEGFAAYLATCAGYLGLMTFGLFVLFWLIPRIVAIPSVHAGLVRVSAFVPLLNILMRNRRLALFLSALSSCLECGIDLRVAIELSAKSTGEERAVIAGRQVVEIIDQGGTFSEAVASMPGAGQRLCSLLATGEEAGDLAASARLQADEFGKSYRRNVHFAGMLFRFMASLFVTAIVAWSLITGFQKVMGDPLSMMPGQHKRGAPAGIEKLIPGLDKLPLDLDGLRDQRRRPTQP
jgi:type II secretory pathway component PulF